MSFITKLWGKWVRSSSHTTGVFSSTLLPFVTLCLLLRGVNRLHAKRDAVQRLVVIHRHCKTGQWITTASWQVYFTSKNVFWIRDHDLLWVGDVMISVRNILHVKHSQYPGVDGYTPDEDSQVIPAVFIMPTTPGASCSGVSHTYFLIFWSFASQEYRNISFCTLSINYLLSASFMAVGNTS